MAYYDIYQVEVRHEGLNKYRLIRGRNAYDVEQRATALKAQWNEIWEKRTERESAIKEKEDKKQEAKERTLEAKEALDGVKNTLAHTLKVNDAINWESLIDKSRYPKSKPKTPKLLTPQTEPKKSDSQFNPKFNTFLAVFFPRMKQEAIKKAHDFFEESHKKWEREKTNIEENNKKLLAKYDDDMRKWEAEELLYIKERDKKNDRILKRKEEYFKKDSSVIVEYCEMVLTNSKYPDSFPQEFDIEYIPESHILMLDYFLPAKEDIPTIKEVKYNISQDELSEKHISELELNKMYDDLLYQITLRSIHELFEADVISVISSIVFNGYVKFIDKGTGKEAVACILSAHAKRDEFLAINLASIEPKACFKSLKGIGSSKLHGLAPVAPIMQLNKEDKRFVSPYSVVSSIDEATNIAAMDWQDFENLIRELFEQEFAPKGGEVKITRASRDEGVDAVIFDPDPLRGGKIVIQAKRYTNVVGVSAVRDLYGTVMNEGAMKGILVTTTDYGPDAYHFAKDKPLTLLNGSNLLHLLEKHGHKAKIDIQEARKILMEKERQYNQEKNS